MIKLYIQAMQKEFKTAWGFFIAAGMGLLVFLNIAGTFLGVRKIYKDKK